MTRPAPPPESARMPLPPCFFQPEAGLGSFSVPRSQSNLGPMGPWPPLLFFSSFPLLGKFRRPRKAFCPGVFLPSFYSSPTQQKSLSVTGRLFPAWEPEYKIPAAVFHSSSSPSSLPSCPAPWSCLWLELMAGGNLFEGLCTGSLITRLAAVTTSSNLQLLSAACPRSFRSSLYSF